MYNNLANIKDIRNSEELEKIKSELLNRLGTNILFEEDTWVCDKLKDSPSKARNQYTLYFKTIPERYRVLAKQFSLMENIKVSTLRNELFRLVKFFSFLEYECAGIEVSSIDSRIINNFELYLNKSNLAKRMKNDIWHCTYKFFFVLHEFNELPNAIPISKYNPWKITKKDIKVDKKYIPKNILEQLDELFKNEQLPTYYRLTYWLMRSIPSRASEIVGMKIECIKPYMNNFILIIPSWKQNGGYLQPQLRYIHIKNTGHGKMILDLVKEQQIIAKGLQSNINESDRGMLFTINTATYKKDRHIGYNYSKIARILRSNRITSLLNVCCERYNIKDENGDIYYISSHQLRHNGITDRLYSGFSLIEIRDMTAHQSNTMIIDSYKHIIKEENRKLQEKVISKENKSINTPLYFRGKVLNLSEDIEKRLLQNPRAYMISDGKDELGICTDIIGCKGNVFECLSCIKFAPKVEQIEFYNKQIKIWERKCVLFRNQKLALENAEYNLKLYKIILSKIKITIEKK